MDRIASSVAKRSGKTGGLSYIYFNARGLTGTVNKLKACIGLINLNIITKTET